MHSVVNHLNNNLQSKNEASQPGHDGRGEAADGSAGRHRREESEAGEEDPKAGGSADRQRGNPQQVAKESHAEAERSGAGKPGKETKQIKTKTEQDARDGAGVHRERALVQDFIRSEARLGPADQGEGAREGGPEKGSEPQEDEGAS